ncbi:MAG: phosphodiester glycosidase family protein [Rhodobacteraceae bacterium]|nr:phosphodiester glycosidase family protein [Paracoccaceae bacterium]
MIRAALIVISCAVFGPAYAGTCEDVEYSGNLYTTCEVDMATDDLRLFLNDNKGAPYGHFTSVDRALAGQGEQLSFAMNAGMYHTDRSPVGHYVENNNEKMRVIPNAGPGNFGLLPNGVFCVSEDRADVIETLTFVEQSPNCQYATQSGPMLVIEGELHPRFLPDSTSRYLRNGVGTTADGQRVVFVISRNAVTFHDFGSLFRDGLDIPSALYFDGNVSRLYAPDVDRHDSGFRMGPIVGVVVPKSN